MARLLACPSCRRHVHVTQVDCPFCGYVGLTTSAPARLSVVLLGLCLVGCTSGKEETKKTPQPINVAPEPELQPTPQPQPEPAPTTAITPEPETPPEPASTTAIEPPPVEGTDAGAGIDDPPPAIEERPEPKPKYGAPRPQKKYGAPPKPPPGEPGF